MNARTARLTATAIVAATAISVIWLAAGRALRPREPHVDVDRSRYPVAGIDLSAHNGIPDFDSIAAAGISFVFLKASEGTDFRDPLFVRNYAAAKRVGIPVGAYHFFRFDCDGRRQAANLLKATDGCLLELPLAIDVEESGNPGAIATETVVNRLETMIAHLRAAGRKVIIYTNKNGDARFVRHNFDGDSPYDPELWICSFTDPPLTRRPWTLWQHSHCSSLPGIKGPVDFNTFNGDRDEWQKWLRRQNKPDTINDPASRYK